MRKLTKALCSFALMAMIGSVGLTAQAASESEPNNTKGSATKIAVETEVTGKLNTADDVDWYSFEITKSGYFYLDFGVDVVVDTTYGWKLYIKKGDTDIFYASGIKESGTTYIMPYEPGTYFVQIVTDSPSSYKLGSPVDVEYSLKVHEVESTEWESESNDTRKTADALQKNQKLNATIGRCDYEGDYFTFELAERSMVTVSFEYDANVKESELGSGMDIFVYKDSNQDANAKHYRNVQDKTFQIALAAGKYYIRVNVNATYNKPNPGTQYTISYTATPTNIYEDFDRVGSKMNTKNTDGLMFYKDSKTGNVYCYEEDGTAVINQFACDGEYTYFFQADRTAMKNRLTYHPDGVHVIYFDENGHEVFSDFAHVKKSIAGDAVDDYCFFDVYGYLYVDVLTYDKTGTYLLYADPYGRMQCYGDFTFSTTVTWPGGAYCDVAGKRGYAESNGRITKIY